MTVELEDNVVRNLTAAAQLVDMLGKNTETRQGFFKLIKKVRPDAPIPELDISKPFEDKVDALSKKFDDFTAGLKQKSQDGELEAARAALRTKHNYTDEGIKELEAFMLKTNTADHEVARVAMEAMRPKPKPERPSFSLRSVFDESDKDDSDWLSNPEAKLDKTLNEAFEAIANGMA